MKRTEKKNKQPDSRIWNRILAVLTVCILLLILLLGFMVVRRNRMLDLTEAYTAETGSGAGSAGLAGRADAFGADLCVSPETVSLEGVSLQAADERALLFNLETREALFAQNIYQQTYPASITKIMTAILAEEQGNMEDTVVITQEDLNLEEGSQMSGLAAGDTVTMDQLYHALVVYSANDAAMAIARQIGGTVEQFVQMMNDKAVSLGMTGTHFSNPHGLHQADHYTTPYDVYLMLNYASQLPAFMKAARLPSYQLDIKGADGTVTRSLYLSSTDQYMTGLRSTPQDVTVLGGKTGTTPEAGSNLAVIVQNRYGVPYMAVVMNALNSSVLYEDMNRLLSQINRDG